MPMTALPYGLVYVVYVPEAVPIISRPRTGVLVVQLTLTPLVWGVTTRLVTVVASAATSVITHHPWPSAERHRRRTACRLSDSDDWPGSAWRTRNARSRAGRPCPAASGCTGPGVASSCR